ncbi:MAG: hypothetical protein JWQ10_163 [Herbaspirillum sp.]|jgi:uncharacterized protein YjbJ (UPF0337 family)|nr:hypothetical protein [Herbaspirillum sp.]
MNMNMNIVLGHAKMMLGICQQKIGRIIGNLTLANAGKQRYFTGKAQVAIGEAQDIIKECLSRLQTR